MTVQEQVYNYFINKGFTPESIIGMMGNMEEESGFKTNNLENSYNNKLGMSDEVYTMAVDNGSYQNFATDSAGYGLVQWTYGPFKKDLLNLCKSRGKSISDLSCQLDQLYAHLQSEGLLNILKNMTSIEQATEYFMKKFEKPANQSASAISRRVNNAQKYKSAFYNKLQSQQATSSNELCIQKGDTGDLVKSLQETLIRIGYSVGPDGADGEFGDNTEKAVKLFQKKNKLEPTGIVQESTRALLWKALQKAKVNPSSSYSGVKLGSASKDERGQYTNGQAGDQTSKEVYILDWYNQNWTNVLRPKEDVLAERIARACEAGCQNDVIGYSQSTRNSLLTEAKKVGLDLSKITTPCNCDCSSFVSTCCVCAGLPENTFFPYGNGCTTYTLTDACLKSGKFMNLTEAQYCNQKDNLKRGDILLNKNQHVVIVLSNGANIAATINTEPEVEEEEKEIQNGFPYRVRVTANTLNVRSGPSPYAQIVAQAKKGQICAIMAEEGGFGKLPANIGWINLNYTERV